MNIPKDKVGHFVGGLVVALVASLIWWGGRWAGIPAPIAAAFLATGVAGCVKEYADWLDNKAVPGMHGVELLDAVATFLGAVPVVLVLWWLQR